MRWAISAGAPLPESIYELWEGKVRIFKQGYGLTEVGPNNFTTSGADAALLKGRNVGKLTYFARARIVDDLGLDVPDGVAGDLFLPARMSVPGIGGARRRLRRRSATGGFTPEMWLYVIE